MAIHGEGTRPRVTHGSRRDKRLRKLLAVNGKVPVLDFIPTTHACQSALCLKDRIT